MENILVAEKVVKQFQNHLALKEVSINVPHGKIFGLLGPNGAGKTTLIRIINQITAPDEGTVFFRGEKLRSRDVKHIGYLPEERGLYRKMKVGEQALYLAQLKGLSKHEAMKRLKYWFEKFEIIDWWYKKVEELSKGMQQKIQFITTVLHKPELLIFDEPFSGFDPINANLLKQEILKLRDDGATVIFSTHNMGSVEELCDHIALINNAEKILDGPIDEIRSEYKSSIYEATFEGQYGILEASLSADYEILDTKQKGNHVTTRFRLLNDTTTNQLLEKLLPLGNIIAFNEIIPNMNDIFIKVVSEQNLSVEQNQN